MTEVDELRIRRARFRARRTEIPTPLYGITADGSIALRALRIRQATEFLITKQFFSMTDLRKLTGPLMKRGERPIYGVAPALHKNSILNIKNLGPFWMIRAQPPDSKRGIGRHYQWRRVPDGVQPPPGSEIRWMWNPQMSTFEQLEFILAEAIRLGFQAPDAVSQAA